MSFYNTTTQIKTDVANEALLNSAIQNMPNSGVISEEKIERIR
jgi:hypothetical protein